MRVSSSLLLVVAGCFMSLVAEAVALVVLLVGARAGGFLLVVAEALVLLVVAGAVALVALVLRVARLGLAEVVDGFLGAGRFLGGVVCWEGLGLLGSSWLDSSS